MSTILSHVGARLPLLRTLVLVPSLGLVACVSPPESESPPTWSYEIADRRWSSLDVGNVQTCAVGIEGESLCWSWNAFVGLDEESAWQGGRFLQISAGSRHTCGLLEDGSATCWGCDPEDTSDTCLAPEGSFTQISAGAGHSCALRNDGHVDCWGCRSWAEDEGEGSRDAGQCDPPDAVFAEVVAGSSVSCGLLVDGGFLCWGDFPYTHPSAGETYTQVDTGLWGGVCALTETGRVACWDGDLALPEETYSRIGVGAYGVLCGSNHEGELICSDPEDQLGGDAPPGPGFTSLSVSYWHACAIDEQGRAVCWGRAAWVPF